MKVRRGASKAPTQLVLDNIRISRGGSRQVKRKAFRKRKKTNHTESKSKYKRKRRKRNKKKRK